MQGPRDVDGPKARGLIAHTELDALARHWGKGGGRPRPQERRRAKGPGTSEPDPGPQARDRRASQNQTIPKIVFKNYFAVEYDGAPPSK